MILWVLGGFCLLVIAAVLGGGYYAYRLAFYSSSREKRTADVHKLPVGEQYDEAADLMHKLIDDAVAVPFEGVQIQSYDKKTLFGRYYAAAENAPLEIMFHGYRGSALRDFSGGFRLAREAGHAVLLVDQRAHGSSGGHTITFGIKEKYDVLSWVDYAVRRFGPSVKIIISGVSMGAATVLEASALNLPANVVGIIADSPYSSPEAIIRKVVAENGLPVSLTMAAVKVGAAIYGGFRLKGGAASAVEKATKPMLIIHGEDDRFVSCEMSREIYARSSSPDKTLLTVPGAGHGISFIKDPAAYRASVDEFLTKTLG